MTQQPAIISVDFELIVYRKGSLRASVNLSRGYMTWRDSWQWSNNFTRTLSDEQVDRVRRQLQLCLDQHEEASQDDASGAGERLPDDPDFDPVSWLITIRRDGDSRQVRGCGAFPDCWQPLKEMIEQISRICFFL